MKTLKRKVYKFEVCVVDFEGDGIDNIKSALQDCRDYTANVVHVGTREVEWHDEIDLNMTDTCDKAYKKLFSKK